MLGCKFRSQSGFIWLVLTIHRGLSNGLLSCAAWCAEGLLVCSLLCSWEPSGLGAGPKLGSLGAAAARAFGARVHCRAKQSGGISASYGLDPPCPVAGIGSVHILHPPFGALVHCRAKQSGGSGGVRRGAPSWVAWAPLRLGHLGPGCIGGLNSPAGSLLVMA